MLPSFPSSLLSLGSPVRARMWLRGLVSRQPRMLWSGGGLLLALLVSLALPGPRIQMGAAQLKGLVGSYTGHGNWLITASYSGSYNVTTTWSNTQGSQSGSVGSSLAGRPYMASGTYDLSGLNTPPNVTDTGGISTSLATYSLVGIMGISEQTMQVSTDSANLRIHLGWLPENGDLNFDPPPSKLAVFYRIGLQTDTTAGAPNLGDHAHADTLVTCDTATISASSTADGAGGGATDHQVGGSNYDPAQGAQFLEKKLTTTNGGTDVDFNIRIVSNVNGKTPANGYSHTADGSTNLKVDFCVAGFNMSRFGPGITGGSHRSVHPGLGGGHHSGNSDPTFTRWLPLAFSPQISSQPFRAQAGALPAPWGNLNCMYSPMLRQEPASPNLDLDGETLELRPTYTSGPGAPFIPLVGSFMPQYAITDATGDRLLFNYNWVSYPDVHSTLSSSGGYYYLINAGPPGAMRSKGDYTYTFQQISGFNQPLAARLIAIQDAQGNTQTLTWGPNNALTVTDSSSGRSLVFNIGANGYLSSVDAPETSTTTHTHTTLNWDANGHCTGINVYTGGTNTLLHADVFAYGGPNGDSVTSEQQGASVASFAYTADPTLQDPFSLPVPRLASAVYGSSSDTSSSDDGGSVAGTYSYTYGPTEHGYNWWGISAHTNTEMDARGTIFRTIFEQQSDTYGPIVGVREVGPTFTGATSINQTRAAFSPNMDNPQLIRVFDQLYYAGLSLQPWQANFDLLGNLTQFSDPLGETWLFGYSADGKHLTYATDPTGITDSFAYGERNNATNLLTTINCAGAGITQFDYNSFGQIATVTTPASSSGSGQMEQYSYAYDNLTGDLTGITDPLGNMARITSYDALGDPLAASSYPDTGNPATSTTPLTGQAVLDASQMLVQTTLPNGAQVVPTWGNGILSQVQAKAPAGAGGGVLAQLGLYTDSRGRLYKMTDGLGTVAQFRFDKNGSITQVWDGLGNITHLVFGSNNEPTSLIWPDGTHSMGMSYDAAGRLRSVTDERGIVTNYVSDATHQLTDVQISNYATQNVHIDHDIAGRLVGISDATGSRVYNYDPVYRRPTSVVTTLSALPAGHNVFTVSYTYNPDGSVATMSSPVGTTTYHYDADGRAQNQTDPFGNLTTWTYDHAGRVTGESTQAFAGATIASNYTYGISGLAGDPSVAPHYLRAIAHSINGSALWTYTLQHSYLEQVLAQQGTGGQSGQSTQENFSYDARGRLTAESDSIQAGQGNVSSSGSYVYDLANNLQGGNTGAWTYNSDSQLTSAPASGGLAGGIGLAYDAAGNLSSMNGSSLSYDCWGRLSGVGVTASYTYDARGHRVSKTLGNVTTYFLYDCDLLLCEIDSGGNVVRSYNWGALGLISDRTSGQSRFYLYDGLANTRFLVGSNGTVLNQAAYTAWGTPLSGYAPATPFGWKGRYGQYLDVETGLIYLNARYYAPALGRFISRDPSSFWGGANPYAYCVDNPVDFFDSEGRCGHIIAGGVIGGLVGAGLAAWNHENIWYGAAKGAAVGAVGAATFGASFAALGGASCANATMAAVGAGAISSAASDVVDQGIDMLSGRRKKYNAMQTLVSAGIGAVTAGLLQKAMGGQCFVAGTLVQVTAQDSRGAWHVTTKPIEQVKQGEYVLARNEHTGKTEVKRVVSTKVRQADVVLTITLADAKTGQAVETITATREHPFYVQDKGFTPAGALAIGNSIVTRAGPALVVKDIQWLRQSEGYTVYNFEVEDDHSYFVGSSNGGAWVHNYENDPPLYKSPTRWGNRLKRQVWAGNKNEEGNVIDAASGNVINEGDTWEMGHKPGWEHRKHIQSLLRRKASRKTFLQERANPDIYQPELPGSNRSHMNEAGDEIDHWRDEYG